MRKTKVLGAMLALSMTAAVLPQSASVLAAAGDSGMIWHAEFEGTEDRSAWQVLGMDGQVKKDGATDPTDFDSLINDGVLTYGYSDVAHGCLRFDFEDKPLDMTGKTNVVWETRFKIDENIQDDSDRMFKMNGNFKGHVNITRNNGRFYYGGVEASVNDTGVAWNENEWYVLKARIDFVNDNYYVEIKDKDGNVTKSNKTTFAAGVGTDQIDFIRLPQAYVNGKTINSPISVDYVRIYEACEPTITYGDGTALSGATQVEGPVLINIKFNSAVTETEAAKITVDNGADVQTIIDEDDPSTVMIYIEELKGRTKYTLSVPQIGQNTETNVTFTTADEDYYLMRAEFDGLDDTSKWMTFLSDATRPYDSPEADFKGEIKDGQMYVHFDNMKFRNFGMEWGTDNSALQIAPDEENVYAEMRFKAVVTDDSTAGNMNFNVLKIWGKNNMTDTYGVEYPEFVILDVKNGELVASSAPNNQNTGIEIEADKEYTIRMNLNYKERKVYATLESTDGTVGESFDFAFRYGLEFEDISRVDMFCQATLSNSCYGYYADYFRIWDAASLGKTQVTYGDAGAALGGAKGIKNGTAVKVVFPQTVTDADVSKIKINNNAEITKELQNDGKTVLVTINGLTNRTKYTLSTPTVGPIPSEMASFMSFEDPAYVVRMEFDGTDVSDKWCNVGNSSGGTGVISNGILETTASSASFDRLGVVFGTGDKAYTVADDNENITIEMKFKYASESGVDLTALQRQLLTVRGRSKTGVAVHDKENAPIAEVWLDNGKLSLKAEYHDVESDFALSPNVWYTIKMRMNYSEKKYYVTAEGSDGTQTATAIEDSFYQSQPYENITEIALQSNNNNQGALTFYTDYFKVQDLGKAAVTEFSATEPEFSTFSLTPGELVKVTVNYESPDERDITIIVAEYNGEELTKVSSSKTKTEIGESFVEIGVTPQSTTTKLKAFCWNSFKGMKSYTEASELE